MAEGWHDERVAGRSHEREDRSVTDPVDPDGDVPGRQTFDIEFGPAVVGLLVVAGAGWLVARTRAW